MSHLNSPVTFQIKQYAVCILNSTESHTKGIFVHLKGEFRDYAEVTKGTCCQRQALKSKLELAEQFQFLPIYR